VELALAHGDAAAAAAVLAASGVAADTPTGHTREVIHLAHLRLLLHRLHRHTGQQAAGQQAAGQQAAGQQALDLAGRILASAEAGGRLGRVIEALANRAIVCAEMPGKQAQARADLQRALELGAASGYVRLFAGLGGDMARLIAEFNPPEELAEALAAYVADLRTVLAAGGREPAAQPQDLIEPLSEREIEVIQLLAQGLTYQQAAARLIVSVNTVRFHVKSIYGKLGVDNRTAALEAARKLSVL
jgi:LuxR family maltose regulon positive regulatory protein